MKYLCLVYLDEKRLNELPDEDCVEFDAGIRKSGHCIASEALQSVQTATTVRVRGGKISMTLGHLLQMADALGLDWSDLFRMAYPGPAPNPETPAAEGDDFDRKVMDVLRRHGLLPDLAARGWAGPAYGANIAGSKRNPACQGSRSRNVRTRSIIDTLTASHRHASRTK